MRGVIPVRIELSQPDVFCSGCCSWRRFLRRLAAPVAHAPQIEDLCPRADLERRLVAIALRSSIPQMPPPPPTPGRPSARRDDRRRAAGPRTEVAIAPRPSIACAGP